MRLVAGILGVIVMLAVTTLVANANTIMGSFSAGSNGNGVEQAFADAWNDSSEFTCTNNSPFTVTATNGPCIGQSATVIYELNGGGTSSFGHNFSYEVRCHENELKQFVGFDGNERGSIEAGQYLFVLDPPDLLTAKTFTASFDVPTLGEWGMIALVAILLTSGIVVILRRYRPSLEAS